MLWEMADDPTGPERLKIAKEKRPVKQRAFVVAKYH